MTDQQQDRTLQKRTGAILASAALVGIFALVGYMAVTGSPSADEPWYPYVAVAGACFLTVIAGRYLYIYSGRTIAEVVEDKYDW